MIAIKLKTKANLLTGAFSHYGNKLWIDRTEVAVMSIFGYFQIIIAIFFFYSVAKNVPKLAAANTSEERLKIDVSDDYYDDKTQTKHKQDNHLNVCTFTHLPNENKN